MSTVTTNDLKELKNLISEKFNDLKVEMIAIKEEQKQINSKLNDLKVDVATLKEGQNALNTRLNDTNKRIDNVDFINRSIFVSLLAGLILGLSKFLFPNLIG